MPTNIRTLWLRLCLALTALASFCAAATAAPVTTHPRILFRAEDLPALRQRMDPDKNPVWAAFNKEIVEKAVIAFNSSSTTVYRLVDHDGIPNSGDEYMDWVRTSFTDHNGVLHKEGDADWMTVPQGAADGNWGNNDAHPAVPEDDVGQDSGNVRLMTEQYAMIYALMARLLDDGKIEHQADRAMFLNMAKVSLFTVIDPASQGTDPSNTLPWRQTGFATNDRSFSQEAFPITVDLIYEDLTPLEKAKIRKAFLEWTEQANAHYYFAPYRVNGQHLPFNSPELLRLNEPEQAERHNEIRLALNNHWGNHLRQMGLYGLALDPQDDVPSAFAAVSDTAVPGSITSQQFNPADGSWTPLNYGALRDATGVWLYLTDYAYRHDGAGGLSVEGIEYASNGLGPVGVFMSALHTAGQDDTAVWGPQVSLKNHPQWSRAVSAYLSMLTPAPRTPNGAYNYLGSIYQPPMYGDLETFTLVNDQFIKFLAPLALTDARINGTASDTVQAVRYIQQNLAKGGPTKLAERIAGTRSEKRLRDSIYYFLLFDPSPDTPAAADPRPAMQPLDFYAAHTVAGKEMGTYFGRTGQTASDTYFHFRTDWNQINHQRGDSLSFGLWKNGLWLTKVMTGYGGLQGASDYRNALSLQNGVPDPSTQNQTNEVVAAEHGSQWFYSPHGDPAITARSLRSELAYFTADATELYNHYHYANLQEITHASRSIVWLKPNHVVVYDRASSKSAGYYKRFFLNLPENTAKYGGAPSVVGNLVHATAKDGGVAKAELFVSALLPVGATPQITDQESGDPGDGEDKEKARMFTEAPGAPQDARFLHVLQGTDAGVATPESTQLLQSTAGTAFEGAAVGARVVLFKKNLGDTVATLTYVTPVGVTEHYITGLAPLAGYSVTQLAVAGGTSVTLTADAAATLHADNGGVLTLGVAALPTVALKASAASVAEAAGTPVTFTVSRSGDVSAPLTVSLGLDPVISAASAADVTGLPSQITIPAGSGSASFDVTPVNDGVTEGSEALVVKLAPGAGYHVDAAAETATVALLETLPASGHVQFSATNFNVAENTASGHGTLTVTRTGGFETALTVHYSITGGTAVAGTDYTTVSGDLVWTENESAAKTIDIPIIDNAVPNGARNIAVTLTAPSIAGAIGAPALATLTIGDDETPGGTDFGGGNNNNNGGGTPVVPLTPGEGTLQFAAADYTVSEAAGTAQLHVSRTLSSVGVVSVSYYTLAYSAIGGTDYQAGGGTVTFADGETDKIISIPVYDNATPQASRYFKVALQGAGNGGVLGALVESTVTITDDDGGTPPPDGGGNNNNGGGVIVVPPANPANPGSFSFASTALSVNEGAGFATLTVNRVGGTDGAVSVNYYTLAGSAHSGTEYGYTFGTLHWAAGESQAQTIDIPLVDDAEEEPTKSFQLTLDSPAGGATLGAGSTATITILDDEVVYHVGPNQQFASLAEVPWTTLAPGNIVRIHWRAEAYKEKLLLSARGTAEKPIKIEGVAGPAGELPVIDGTGATAAANIGYAPWFGDVMERSIIAVARNATQPSAYKPGYLVISNLELTMSGAQNPMPTYVKPDGSAGTYYTSAGAIFLYGAEHVTVRDCDIHDTPNGIVAASGSSEAALTRDLTVEHCWLYHAGKGGSYNGSNLVTEAIRVTVQFSRLDRGLNGSNTPNVLDRSAGVVVRYNRIEGGANLLSFIEPVSAPALIVADPSFATTHVYGNILRNGGGDYGTDGSTLIRYGGDWSSAANFRAGTLHFHHNTVVMDSQRWSTSLFNLTLAAAQVVANNNVVHRVKSGAGPFDLINSGRNIVLGRNWTTSNVTVGGNAVGGTALVLKGASPGFVNLATGDLHPAAGSPLLDAAQPLPAGALPVEFEYLPEADGQPRTTQGAAPDLGALEVAPGS
ncbi:MAG: hypothetical protein KF715_11135 [Candidatus Didemnitutus sp.]|nr:hypothetical protein [Candidatus Didemnitutus sp.]